MFKSKIRSFHACVVAAGMVVLPMCLGGALQAAPATPPAQTPPVRPIMGVNDAHNPLHLTADQQKKLQVIVDGIIAERSKLTANTALSQQQKQTQYVAFVKNAQTQMKALLTPAQVAANDERTAQVKSEVSKYNQGVLDIGKKAVALQAQFKASLTPAELASIKTANLAAQKQWAQIQANKSLTPQQLQQQGQQLEISLNSKVDHVLTPKQLAMVDQLKEYRQEAMALARLAQAAPETAGK